MSEGVGARLKAVVASIQDALGALYPGEASEEPPRPGEIDFTLSWGGCGGQELTVRVAESSVGDLVRVVEKLAAVGKRARQQRPSHYVSFPYEPSPAIADLEVGTGLEREIREHLGAAESRLRQAAECAKRRK